MFNSMFDELKDYIIDVQQGYILASENIEIFKVKLRWSKLSRLLQRVAFFLYISFKTLLTDD